MEHLFRALLSLIFLGSFAFSEAAVENENQVWSILRYEKNYSQATFGVQLQNRYDNSDGKVFEEQLNLNGSYKVGAWLINFIATLGTQDLYDQIREIRYALETERDFLLGSDWNYNLRVRQELRDFKKVTQLAHRFRIRNEIGKEFQSLWGTEISLSSEFNFYLNNYVSDVEGFSSHRTILGGTRAWAGYDIGLAYLNDYRKNPGADEVRHVLLLSLEYSDE